MLTDEKATEIYKQTRDNTIIYNEARHCTLLLKVMGDPKKSRLSAFCAAVGISESKFYKWVNEHELFRECYLIGQVLSRENWENQGEELRDEIVLPGTSNHKFEHWRMMGWARFGVGKNSRIRLKLNSKSAPNEHYSQLLEQAAEGDFTAGEIKQLMEAINVGMSAHQVFNLQKEIDQLKFDLTIMNENTHGDNSLANKGITKKD
jgi:hypothetical protein